MCRYTPICHASLAEFVICFRSEIGVCFCSLFGNQSNSFNNCIFLENKKVLPDNSLKSQLTPLKCCVVIDKRRSLAAKVSAAFQHQGQWCCCNQLALFFFPRVLMHNIWINFMTRHQLLLASPETLKACRRCNQSSSHLHGLINDYNIYNVLCTVGLYIAMFSTNRSLHFSSFK